MVLKRSPDLAITQWYDNKPVLMASIAYGKDPKDVQVQVRRPAVIREYGCQHGWSGPLGQHAELILHGKQKKWTNHVITNFFDAAITSLTS